MATFDPKKNNSGGGDGGRDLSKMGVPAGPFLLAMVDFDKKISQRDKPYIRGQFLVIAGPAKGKKFKDVMSLDIDNSGSMARLSLLCTEIGQTESFDLEDESELRRVLLNKPFKAMVNRKIENGYVNNGVERFLVGDKVSAAERETMQAWLIARADETAYDQHPNEPGGGDEDAPPPLDDDAPF